MGFGSELRGDDQSIEPCNDRVSFKGGPLNKFPEFPFPFTYSCPLSHQKQSMMYACDWICSTCIQYSLNLEDFNLKHANLNFLHLLAKNTHCCPNFKVMAVLYPKAFEIFLNLWVKGIPPHTFNLSTLTAPETIKIV